MERVADYVMKRIQQLGVDTVFLITGRGILFLTDALAREKDIQAVSTFHEQGASYAAMAYAQQKDAPAVCLVSTGCAATNAITALLCAWQDNVPVIFISGQHMLGETVGYTHLPIRTYGSQESDIISLVCPITKYATMLTEPERVGYELDRAIHAALAGRRGPVWLDIPLDVQNARIDQDLLLHFTPPQVTAPSISPLAVHELMRELRAAERPLLLVGGGAREAAVGLTELVERWQIPVVCTPSGNDIYGAANVLSIGTVGSIGGSRAGNFALQQADYIVAIGSRLCSQLTGGDYEQFAPGARVVAVDIDEHEHEKQGVKYHRVIHSSALSFVSALLEHDLTVADSWRRQCQHWRAALAIDNENFVRELIAADKIDLYIFAHALEKTLGASTTVITDAGFEELIVPSAIRYGAGQRCLFPAAQGAMGYAIPAILGAHYAGATDVVCVVGDGSIMMNMQELYIIAARGIPAKIFIINNDMYAVIRNRQQFLFRRRTIGNDPSDGVPAPDFCAMAASLNIRYERIERYAELDARLAMVRALDELVICEVMCVPEQRYLHKSYAMNEKRRLEQRPLDDLSPFMARERLAAERNYQP